MPCWTSQHSRRPKSTGCSLAKEKIFDFQAEASLRTKITPGCLLISSSLRPSSHTSAASFWVKDRSSCILKARLSWFSWGHLKGRLTMERTIPYLPFHVVEVFATSRRLQHDCTWTLPLYSADHMRAPHRFDHFWLQTCKGSWLRLSPCAIL